MKGGCVSYPNKGVKIDPRAITSAKMPESLKVYSGFLNRAFLYLKGEGILKRADIDKVYHVISNLPPVNRSNDKMESSYWFYSDTCLVEFLRTSINNFKVYALKVKFFKNSKILFPG